MKYIVIEIQTNADGSVGTLLTAYDRREEAESKYHTVLAAAARSELPMHSAVILTNDGLMFARESYEHKEEGENE